MANVIAWLTWLSLYFLYGQGQTWTGKLLSGLMLNVTGWRESVRSPIHLQVTWVRLWRDKNKHSNCLNHFHFKSNFTMCLEIKALYFRHGLLTAVTYYHRTLITHILESDLHFILLFKVYRVSQYNCFFILLTTNQHTILLSSRLLEQTNGTGPCTASDTFVWTIADVTFWSRACVVKRFVCADPEAGGEEVKVISHANLHFIKHTQVMFFIILKEQWTLNQYKLRFWTVMMLIHLF